MKVSFISIVLFLFSTISLSAQTGDSRDWLASAGMNFTGSEKPAVQAPAFPGGNQALAEFMANHLEYPLTARELAVEGRVVLELLIDQRGEVRVNRVVKSLDPACDTAAITAAQQLPRWRPALRDGRSVAQKIRLPIHFQLD